jgi:Ca2+/Na+ antiporter
VRHLRKVGLTKKFSSILLDILLGVGVTVFSITVSTGQPFVIEVTNVLRTTTLCFLMSLGLSLLIIPVNGFKIGSRVGHILIAEYLVIAVVILFFS